MSRWVVTLAIFIICFKPIIGLAEHTNDWKKLDVITDQALQLVKHQKVDDAKNLLTYFNDQFSKSMTHENSFTMDEIRVISSTYEDAQVALATEAISLDEQIKAVTKFRFVVDAVKSEHQPLWVEMENTVMGTFKAVKEAAKIGDTKEFDFQLTQFLGEYEVIYPSVKLDLDVAHSNLVNSYVTFLDESRSQVIVSEARMDHLQVMEEELTRMFKQMKKDDADPSLIWVMISTGSIIILTLSYVGWRKYKGDKEKQSSIRRLND